MKRIKKVVLTGVLALSPIIGVTAASAAPLNTTADLSNLTKQYGIDLNSILQGQGQSGNLSDLANKYGIDLNKLLQGKEGQWQSLPIGNGNVLGGGMWKQLPGNFDWNNCFGGNSGNAGGGAGQGNVDNGSQNGGNVDNGNGGGNADNGNAGNTGSNNGGTTGSEQGNVSTEKSAFATEVINLVNKERAKGGLPALTEDKALSNMALDKAKDMYNNNYFDHNSPTYGSPFDMMRTYGIKYSYAGENIAKGQRNPQEVMNAWMNSTGHRQNIMSPNFTKIGVAYHNGVWVQEFIAN